MKETIVVNRKLEKFDVYIGRGSAFGNPFPVHNGEFSLKDSLRLYEHHLWEKIITEPLFKEKILALSGKKLGCSCKKAKSSSAEFLNDETPCHGDIIVEALIKLNKY